MTTFVNEGRLGTRLSIRYREGWRQTLSALFFAEIVVLLLDCIFADIGKIRYVNELRHFLRILLLTFK